MKVFAVAARDTAPMLLDVSEVTPGPGELLVAVEAASINGFDVAVAAGRVWDAMPHEFPVVLGRDFVGIVAGVAADVDGFAVGDRVAGLITGSSLGPGSLGDYVAVPATAVTHVPTSVDARDAAAIGLAGIAAGDAVETLHIRPGDIVLISGATGGVGSFAVQLSAMHGATVLATARPGREDEYVRALGASHTVDYTGDLAAGVRAIAPEGVAGALHAAGDPTSLAALVRPGGVLASMLGATNAQVKRDDITVTAVVATGTPDKLAHLLDDVANRRLRVHIGAALPLDRADEALTAFRNGTLGKVLVTRSVGRHPER